MELARHGRETKIGRDFPIPGDAWQTTGVLPTIYGNPQDGLPNETLGREPEEMADASV